MGIIVLIFTATLQGSSVQKTYYIVNDQLIIREIYCDEKNTEIGKTIMYTELNLPHLKVFRDNIITEVSKEIMEEDSWCMVIDKIKIIDEIDETYYFNAENRLCLLKKIGPTIDSSVFENIDFYCPNFSLINEVVKYDSSYYVIKKSETTFNGLNIFDLSLNSIRKNAEHDLLEFKKLKQLFL